jgi:hypothetical protein
LDAGWAGRRPASNAAAFINPRDTKIMRVLLKDNLLVLIPEIDDPVPPSKNAL